MHEAEGGAAGRPAQVTLWGVPGYKRDYLVCLEEAGIGVALWVDGRHAGGEIEGVKVISPEEYARRCHLYQGLPIVFTARGPHDADGFNDALLAAVNEFDLPGRLLHPVFVADHLRLDYDGRAVLGGFPGSGNTTARHVVGRLLARREVPLQAREELVANLASDYHFHTLLPAIDGLFDLGGRYASLASAVGGDRIRVEMQLAGGRLAMVCKLRSRTFLYERVHPTHEFLTPATVERFRGLNLTALAIVRHPLDVLVSNAARLCRPPDRALAHGSWFRHMAAIVKQYYTHLLEQQDRGVAVVRYERLLEAPAETVQQIGRALGLDVGRADAEALWDEAGFKPIERDVVGSSLGHVWRPGAGRWREVLRARHMGVLTELGYGPFLRELGYDTRLEAADDGATFADTTTFDRREQQAAAYLDFGFHVLYDKPLDFRHDGFTR